MTKLKNFCCLALALLLFAQIAEGSLSFSNLRQDNQFKDEYQSRGNTQQNNPNLNQLLTNEESLDEEPLSANALSYSNLGYQSHFQESVQMKNHAKKVKTENRNSAIFELGKQQNYKQLPSLEKKNLNDPKNYDHYFNKFDRTQNGMIKNLRGYLTEYESAALGKYGLLLLFVIGIIVSTLTCKNMSKLKEGMQEMKQQYQKRDKERRRQLKLLMKTSEKKIRIPQQDQSDNSSNQSDKLKS